MLELINATYVWWFLVFLTNKNDQTCPFSNEKRVKIRDLFRACHLFPTFVATSKQGFVPRIDGLVIYSHPLRTAPKAYYGTPADLKQCSNAVSATRRTYQFNNYIVFLVQRCWNSGIWIVWTSIILNFQPAKSKKSHLKSSEKLWASNFCAEVIEMLLRDSWNLYQSRVHRGSMNQCFHGSRTASVTRWISRTACVYRVTYRQVIFQAVETMGWETMIILMLSLDFQKAEQTTNMSTIVNIASKKILWRIWRSISWCINWGRDFVARLKYVFVVAIFFSAFLYFTDFLPTFELFFRGPWLRWNICIFNPSVPMLLSMPCPTTTMPWAFAWRWRAWAKRVLWPGSSTNRWSEQPGPGLNVCPTSHQKSMVHEQTKGFFWWISSRSILSRILGLSWHPLPPWVASILTSWGRRFFQFFSQNGSPKQYHCLPHKSWRYPFAWALSLVRPFSGMPPPASFGRSSMFRFQICPWMSPQGLLEDFLSSLPRHF